MKTNGMFKAAIGLFVLLFISSTCFAVPAKINFQGKLQEDGTSFTGFRTITFSIWDNDVGGDPASALWSETQIVEITDSIYNVELGIETTLPYDLHTHDNLFLQLDITHPSEGTQTLGPLMPFNSTVFALKAANAEEAQTLEGYTSADFALVVHGHSGNDITSGTVDEAYIDPDIARDSEITWTNLSGIPADIADGDDGLTSETDPTVDPSVKDGVAWNELSNIPAGFADGVDNNSGGDITGVTAGTGLSGGGSSGDVTLSLSVPLSLSGSSTEGIISGENTYLTGLGIYGYASNTGNYTNYGGYFQADGYYGRGVYGTTSGTNGLGVFGDAKGSLGSGVYGRASGTSGSGVRGYASNTGDVENYGGYFQADGRYGRGVYGIASNSGYVENYGGYFQADAIDGRGVYGESSGARGHGVHGYASNSEDHQNYGGYFQADGWNGSGIYGYAPGRYGRGVYGVASNTGNYTNYGGYFRASGESGRGVYGRAWDSGDGENYGGYFEANGTQGRGVYGRATGASGRGVYGYAWNSGDVYNYGGYFQADGTHGRGVYGAATGTSGEGVYGYASGSSGVGVYGRGQLYDFYAAGPGTNYGSSSSIRWKENIREIQGALEMILQMRGVYFDWDAEHGGQHDMGFIAEEVGEFVPEVVEFEQDKEYASGMDYGKMTPILVQAIKEQQALIKDQDRLIKQLKNKQAAMHERLAKIEALLN